MRTTKFDRLLNQGTKSKCTKFQNIWSRDYKNIQHFVKQDYLKGSVLQITEGERSIILAKIVINKEGYSKTTVGKL